MPSLLFRSALREQRLERGHFSCPECARESRYARVRVRRSLAVLGQPLLSMGTAGEYIECSRCQATFRPEVLAYDAGRDTARVMAEYQRAVARVLALMVAADGAIQAAEIEAVQEVFEAVTGRRLTLDEVSQEVDAVAHAPASVARYLAAVVGFLNEYGREQVLRAAALISCADGQVHENERRMLRRLAGVMGIEPTRTDAVLAELA